MPFGFSVGGGNLPSSVISKKQQKKTIAIEAELKTHEQSVMLTEHLERYGKEVISDVKNYPTPGMGVNDQDFTRTSVWRREIYSDAT